MLAKAILASIGGVGLVLVPRAPIGLSLVCRGGTYCAGTASWGCGAGSTVAKMHLQQNVVMPLK